MQHECDCGRRYSNLDALLACQNANHGGPRPAQQADAFHTSVEDDGLTFNLIDSAGNTFATAKLLSADLPSFVSQLLSQAGHDELGRDTAIAMQTAR